MRANQTRLYTIHVPSLTDNAIVHKGFLLAFIHYVSTQPGMLSLLGEFAGESYRVELLLPCIL